MSVDIDRPQCPADSYISAAVSISIGTYGAIALVQLLGRNDLIIDPILADCSGSKPSEQAGENIED